MAGRKDKGKKGRVKKHPKNEKAGRTRPAPKKVEQGQIATLIPEVLPAAPKKAGLPVPISPLQQYLVELRNFPLLTREEEHELAVRYQKTHDQEAAYRLITSNLRLVVKIALEFQRAFVNILDLIQEGNIGLLQAISKYDPYKGVKLSSYASWWIRAYILRYILNNWRMVKIGTSQAQRKLFYNLHKEKERLERMGYAPLPAQIARELDVPQRDVEEMQHRLSQSEISLDTPLSEDMRTTVGDMIPTHQTQADEVLGNEQQRNLVQKLVEEFAKDLNEKEKIILFERMYADTPKTLQELGEKFKITRERVRQLESRLIKKLKKYFEAHGIHAP